jgi:hypothetical protein
MLKATGNPRAFVFSTRFLSQAAFLFNMLVTVFPYQEAQFLVS